MRTTSASGSVLFDYVWDNSGRLGEAVDRRSGMARTTKFTYDPSGQRVSKVDPDGVITLYIGATEIVYDPRKPVGGRLSVARTYGPVVRGHDGTMSFAANTHQGSVAAALTVKTSAEPQIELTRYRPYGELREGAGVNDRAFLNQVHDTDLGLHHLNARYYNPTIGQFISVDPLVAATQEPYVYAAGNPILYSDPTGLIGCWSICDAAKSVAGSVGDFGRGAWSGVTGTVTGAVKVVSRYNSLTPSGVKNQIDDAWAMGNAFVEDPGATTKATFEAVTNLDTMREEGVWFWMGSLAPDAALAIATGGGSASTKAVTVVDEIADVAQLVDELPDVIRATEDLVETAGRLCSFAGATLVLMADGSFERIDRLVPGDVVWASDPETGVEGPRVVTHTWVHGDTLVDLVVADGDRVATTEDHPFWNESDREWQRADQLDEGEWLLGSDGQLVVVGGVLEGSTRWGTAYNLTVDDLHSYYVVIDDTPVLVHNTCSIHRHHSDPKFMGGDPKQPLVNLPASEHQGLHPDLNDFLFNRRNAAGDHMRPQRGNSGKDIQRNFPREERVQAMADFYKSPVGAKYPTASEGFFRIHPSMR